MCQNWEQRHEPRMLRQLLPAPVWVLCTHNQSIEDIQTLAEQITLQGQGNRLPDRGTKAKELTNLIKGTTKACCRREASKPTHGVIALFNATMILFYEIVEIVIHRW